MIALILRRWLASRVKPVTPVQEPVPMSHYLDGIRFGEPV